MDPVQATTTSPLADFAFRFVIFLSEVVFQWVPAIIYSITGIDVVTTGERAPVPATPTNPGTGTPQPPASSAEPMPFPGTAGQEQGIFDVVRDMFAGFADLAVPILIFIALIILTAFIYAFIRFGQVTKQADKAFEAAYRPPVSAASAKREQWEKIAAQAYSQNPGDWRLAIIEADIMLDKLLDSLGYTGDTTGEKMKQVERSNFRTIDAAWEAHKLRNDIAHQGNERELNQREVQQAIRQYEQVFREFEVI